MKKYHGIQILRFLAAALVVVEHLTGNVLGHWSKSYHSMVPAFGEIGVVVFFGISGFIMITTQYESFGNASNSANFFVRRLLRVLPIYAIATTLQFINKFNFSADYTFLNYIKSLLFIPYLDAHGLFRPVLAQGWTLNYEMFFYLVFAISLAFNRVKGLLLGMAVFVALAASHEAASKVNVFFEFYSSQMLVFFVCGMLIGIVKKKTSWSSEVLAFPILCWLILIPASLLLEPYMDPVYWFGLNLCMVSICVFSAASYQAPHYGKGILFFELLGDISYSTYLFHGFVLGASKFLSNRVADGEVGKLIALNIFCIVTANVAGLVVYTFIEKPIARSLKNVGKQSQRLVERPKSTPI